MSPVLLFLFILGAIIGSFLNVVVLRTKSSESFARGRSKCPKCSMALKFFELLPIISFIIQRGKCRYCSAKISWQYPLVEFFTALLFLVAGYFFLSSGNWLSLIINLVFICFAVLIFVYDFRWQIIPDRFSLPAVVIILVLNLFAGVSIWSMLIGAAIAGGFFALQFLVSRGKWIGGGDIRLGVLVGVLLGWEKAIVVLFIAYVGGAIISLMLIALSKKKMDSQIAFGTFLTAASLVALFWGDKIINWYLNII